MSTKSIDLILNMKRTLLTFTVVAIIGLTKTTQSFAQGSNIIELTGHIIDQNTKEPLPGITVTIQGTVNGTSTNNQGDFKLNTKAKYPFTLKVSGVGFETKTYEITGPQSNLNLSLLTQTILGKEVVVTASRTQESILSLLYRLKNWILELSENHQLLVFTMPLKMLKGFK